MELEACGACGALLMSRIRQPSRSRTVRNEQSSTPSCKTYSDRQFGKGRAPNRYKPLQTEICSFQQLFKTCLYRQFDSEHWWVMSHSSVHVCRKERATRVFKWHCEDFDSRTMVRLCHVVIVFLITYLFSLSLINLGFFFTLSANFTILHINLRLGCHCMCVVGIVVARSVPPSRNSVLQPLWYDWLLFPSALPFLFPTFHARWKSKHSGGHPLGLPCLQVQVQSWEDGPGLYKIGICIS